MRKLPAFALAVAAACLAGAALAASPKTHKMDVPLPDGSVAHIEYVGNVAPKVIVAPRSIARGLAGLPVTFPSFAGFDQMIAAMNRRTQEIARQAAEMVRQPANGGPYIAAYGDVPAGGLSTTVVSVTNGGATCTRTTEVVSQGTGKPSKVSTSTSGQCAIAPPAPPQPVTRT